MQPFHSPSQAIVQSNASSTRKSDGEITACKAGLTHAMSTHGDVISAKGNSSDTSDSNPGVSVGNDTSTVAVCALGSGAVVDVALQRYAASGGFVMPAPVYRDAEPSNQAQVFNVLVRHIYDGSELQIEEAEQIARHLAANWDAIVRECGA